MKIKTKEKKISKDLMENRKLKIIEMINISIYELDKAIINYNLSGTKFGDIDVLKNILEELYLMKKYLSPSKYFASYGRIIIDSCNYTDPLADKLLAVAQFYNEKLS
jgi:hypothetical protein